MANRSRVLATGGDLRAFDPETGMATVRPDFAPEGATA
jgi:hypothetical protein